MPRKVIVTGGTRGIGRIVSRQMSEKGYSVAAVYGGNAAAAGEFNRETGIPVYKIDVSDFESCKEGVLRIEREVGPPTFSSTMPASRGTARCIAWITKAGRR